MDKNFLSKTILLKIAFLSKIENKDKELNLTSLI
jgi:hypothetical protein